MHQKGKKKGIAHLQRGKLPSRCVPWSSPAQRRCHRASQTPAPRWWPAHRFPAGRGRRLIFDKVRRRRAGWGSSCWSTAHKGLFSTYQNTYSIWNMRFSLKLCLSIRMNICQEGKSVIFYWMIINCLMHVLCVCIQFIAPRKMLSTFITRDHNIRMHTALVAI